MSTVIGARERIYQATASNRFRLGIRGRVTVIAVCAIVLLNVYARAEPTLLERGLASAGILVASIPISLWLSSSKRRTAFVPFFAGVYSVYYLLPVFWLERYSRDFFRVPRAISHEFMEYALLLSVIGLALMLVAYYGSERFVFGRRSFTVKLHWHNVETTKMVAMILGSLGILWYYVGFIATIPVSMQQLILYLGDCSQLAIAILLILQLHGRLRTDGKVFLWGILIPTRLLLGFSSGYTGQALEVIMLMFLTYATIRRRLPFRSLFVMFFIMIFFLLPLRSEFRSITWLGSDAQRNPFAKASIYATMAWDYIWRENLNSQARDASLSRLAHLTTLAEVIEFTPDAIPYWGGETYYPLLFKPIPRFLYPDKPEELTGQTFGHRYGFLDATDFETSYNLPQLVEFYGNFGTLGVVIGMFLLGMLYRFIEGILMHAQTGLGAAAGFMYLGTKLLLIESSLSGVVGGIFWSTVFLAALHVLMKWMEGVKTTRRQAHLGTR
jgi:hypothetical protein